MRGVRVEMLQVGAGLIAVLVSMGVGRTGGAVLPVTLSGTVSLDGSPVAGAFVTARDAERSMQFTVYSDAAGTFAFSNLPDGRYEMAARHTRHGEARADITVSADEGVEWLAVLSGVADRYGPGSDWFGLLPDGEAKRGLIVDCGACHVFNEERVLVDGRVRTESEWRDALALMLGQFGQGTGFPIISGARDAERDAAWLAASITDPPAPPSGLAEYSARVGDAILTEYDVPQPVDLAHDLMMGPQGRVLVTGMFTHQLYVLNPASGAWTLEAIPVAGANPRALDIAADGTVWSLLGAPGKVAGWDPDSGEWVDHYVGMYGHSIAIDESGRAWTNGHFTVGPELIKSVDLGTGELTEYEVPAVAMGLQGESTIPYGLRVAPNGVVWATQLRGSHLIRVDPASGSVDLWETPTSNSGPRRLDVGPDGIVWIPEFSAGKLARFDPGTETFTEYDLPISDALPYIARVDQQRNVVWIGTGAADAVLAFDPATEDFSVYPLPTRGVLIRHIDVDEASGDLWAAYSASPGIPGKVLRLQDGSRGDE